MSLTRYLLGCLALAAIGVPAAAWSVGLRRFLLPGWSGAPARLVELVVGLGTLWVVLQVLGTVGWFEVGPAVVVIAVVCVGGARIVHGRTASGARGPEPAPDPGPEQSDRRADRFMAPLAAAGVALVVAQWAAHAAASLREGTAHQDTLWYHLPRAARFAQASSFTDLHFTRTEFPDTFHPATSEVFHGLGMLLFGHDAFSPFLNVAWLAVALLAAWCIGRPFGVAPLSMLGVAVVCSTPRMVTDSVGTASNDIAALALLLAAVAVLLQAERTPAVVMIAGLAAGTGLSVKLTLVAPIALLTVGLVVVTPRAARARTAIAWVVPLVGAGAYWYLRNWIRTGTPVAGLDLPGLPSPRFEVVDELGFSVTDYAFDGTAWRDWLLPGLGSSFGPGWVLILAIGAIGAIGALRGRRRDHALPALGLVVIGGAVAYAGTPTSALGPEGAPLLFAANLIYLTPVLGLGLALVPLAVRSSAAATKALGAILGALIALNLWDTVELGDRAQALAAAAVLAMALAAAGLAVLGAGRPPRRVPLAIGAGLLLVAAVGGAESIVDAHLRSWYGTDALAAAVGEVDDGSRIAVAGAARQWRLYGRSLDHHVQYLGVQGDHGSFHQIDRCEIWRRALSAGRYQYVVVGAGERERLDRDQIRWTETDPSATLVASAGRRHLYRLQPGEPVGRCG